MPTPANSLWQGLTAPVKGAWDTLQSYGQIPAQADSIADQQFPDSARDASTKNAFRHALGTGMLTQALGGGAIGAALAKGAGYAWEGLGTQQYLDSASYRNDTRHDLNANALGATAGKNTSSQQELIATLRQMADQSKQATPPGIFSSSPGYMTRTAR